MILEMMTIQFQRQFLNVLPADILKKGQLSSRIKELDIQSEMLVWEKVLLGLDQSEQQNVLRIGTSFQFATCRCFRMGNFSAGAG